MKKLIILFAAILLVSVISEFTYSQWIYGNQPFSTSAPYLSTQGSAVNNKVPTTYMYDSLQFPYPTNAWFANAIMKQGTFPSFNYNPTRQDVGSERIYPFPYIVRARLVGDVTNTKLFGFGYVTPANETYNWSWNAGDSTNLITWLSDVYYYFSTLDSANLTKGTLYRYDDLSATFRWFGSGTNYMECPVVRGMPYFTMKYQGLKPMFYSPANAMLSVNGNTIAAGTPVDVTDTKFKIYFAGSGPNQQLFVLYSSSAITLSFLPNGFTCSTPFNGYLRIAYITTQNSDPNASDSTARMQLLDAYSPYVPLGGRVTANVTADTTKFNFMFNFTTNSSSDSLLMVALPHHQDMMGNTMTDIMKFKCLRGDMKEVHGKVWYMNEWMIPKYSWSPVNNLSMIPVGQKYWYDSLYLHLKADFDTTIGARYQIPNGTNQPTTSPYGFGKNVCRMARVIVIADELIDLYQINDPGNWRKDTLTYLASQARDSVFNWVKKWVDGQNLIWNPPPPPWAGGQNNKLIWDNKYGGIISYLGWVAMDNPDPNVYNFDFGNARYNDHAFHYGYVIYAAAVIAKKKPELFSNNSNEYYNKVLDLCRDIGSPTSPASPQNDPYFPMHRHKDWYDGNSWMNGIQSQGAGRDQESVSEAANAWYGMYLFGLAMGNENLKNTGKLMLASEMRTFRKYYRTFQNTNQMFQGYNTKHIIVGNLWHSLIINNTYGKAARFIYGVHMLPKNPFIEQMWDTPFSQEVWNKIYTNNQSSTLFQDLELFSTYTTGMFNISTYNMPVQAVAYPDTAYNYFQKYRGFSGNFDDGTCKSDCFYWIITRKFATVGINQIGTEIPERYQLMQNYPNPFNPMTSIEFSIPKQGFVRLNIYDITGRLISTLLNENKSEGSYRIQFDASKLSSGVYFYKMESGNFVSVKRMILVK